MTQQRFFLGCIQAVHGAKIVDILIGVCNEQFLIHERYGHGFLFTVTKYIIVHRIGSALAIAVPFPIEFFHNGIQARRQHVEFEGQYAVIIRLPINFAIINGYGMRCCSSAARPIAARALVGKCCGCIGILICIPLEQAQRDGGFYAAALIVHVFL